MNSEPMFNAANMLTANSMTASPSGTHFLSKHHARILPYISVTFLWSLLSFCSLSFNIVEDIAGTSVNATSKLEISENAMVRPMSPNNSFVSPCVNAIGRNTQIVVNVEAIIGPVICFAPSTAARITLVPRCLSRYMFSIVTMLLSTSIPTPNASPASESTFKLTLLKYMSTMASIRLIGMLTPTISVDLALLKNRNSITMASTAPYSRFSITVPITISMYTP